MRAFPENMSYADSLNIIRDYMNKLGNEENSRDQTHGFLVKPQSVNDQGLEFLVAITDEETQKKIIRLFYYIDSELSYSGVKTTEMFKKINSLLSVGGLFHDYPDIANSLSTQELFIVINGFFSIRTESDLKLIRIFTDKELLKSIEERYKEIKNIEKFGFPEYFFLIKAHYAKLSFESENEIDPNNDGFRKRFVDDMIQRIKDNRLGDGVPNMQQYLNHLLNKQREEGVTL